MYCLSFYLRLLITTLVSSTLSLSFCPFHFVIVLSVLLLFTTSDYLFGIFKLLFVLLPFSFCHCIVCPSPIYGFWLPLWYLQASLCPFALFLLLLYCLSFFYLRLLITPLVSSRLSLSYCPFSFCHCIVCPSSIYGFWLPHWYLQASVCPFVLFLLSLYCLSFYLRLLITSLVSTSLSLSFCPFHFVIVLSVLLLFTASDYPFGIFKIIFVLLSLFPFVIVLSVLLLFTASDYLIGIFKLLFVLWPFSFVIVLSVLLFTASDYLFGIIKLLFVLLPFSICHCIVCPSIYGFWLPLWYLQASLCPFAFFLLSLYCLSFFYLRLLITSLVSSSFSLSFCPFHFVIVLSVLLFTASDYLFGIFKPLFVLLPFSVCHCIVCPSPIYGFWLPLWYLQASLCPFALFLLSLYCLSFYLRLLITSLVPSSFSLSFCPFHFVIVLSVLLLFMASDYLFGTFKLLFVPLPFFFCHCIVCPSSIYCFWLPLWYLQASLCPFVFFLLSLYCLSFFYWRFLITSLVSSSFSLSFCPFSFFIVLSVVLLYTASDYPFGIFKLFFVLLPFFFCHCIVYPSSIYGFWLPFWYLQASLCPFALFLLSLYCLFFFYLRLLITFLVPLRFSLSFCPFSFVIVLSVLLFTASEYLFGIFKLLFVLLPFFFSFYCLSFYLRLLITSLVSSSLSLSFWPFHSVILLSILVLFTASDYLFGTFKLLFVPLPFFFCHCIVCPSSIYASDYLFCTFKLLFVLLPCFFCHCIVCRSSIDGFWLPLWYLQASLCPFALFLLSLYCLSFYLRILITSLVSSSLSLSFCHFFCHCIVCPSSIYGFWLPFWYLQASLCPFALFLLSLYCLSFYLRLLITPLVPSSLSLSFCPFFVIVLSVLLLFTTSVYLFGTFKLVFVLLPFFLSLYCLSFFYLRLLITSLVSSSLSLSFCPFHFVIVLSVLFLITSLVPSILTASDYLFGTFKLLFVLLTFFVCHCSVCPSIYGFWLPLWYLQASLCPFALFILSLYCLSFFYLRLLITSLVSSSLSLSFCPFHFVIVLSVLLLFTASDYLFGTFKLLFCPFALFILSLYCLSFYLRLLITSLVSTSLSLSFCPFHFVIVLSVLLLFTASDYLIGIFKLLFVLLSFFFCHCIVCPSIYGFWLPRWYLQASLCPFVLFILSLYCLYLFY